MSVTLPRLCIMTWDTDDNCSLPYRGANIILSAATTLSLSGSIVCGHDGIHSLQNQHQ